MVLIDHDQLNEPNTPDYAIILAMIAYHKSILTLIGVCLAACAGCTAAKVSLPQFTGTLERGHYTVARSLAVGQIGGSNKPKDLLWSLQAGSAERLLKNHAASNRFFDRTEDYFRFNDLRSIAERSWQNSRSFLYNESLLPYTGRHHDRIMVNTYKALNFAALGDFQNARVEFNRALARQNDAKAYFAAETEELNAYLARQKQEQPNNQGALGQTLDNPGLDKIIHDHYKNLDGFKAYADFVNPFTTYMAGLFFWLDGKTPSKGVDLLKEAYAMSGDNTFVAQDLARATRGDVPRNEVWVIYENGLAPGREEIRMDIPIFFIHQKVNFISMAFPQLTAAKSAYGHLNVSAAGERSVQTQLLADMESVIGQEFKKELPSRMAREVARMAIKVYMQYYLSDQYGSWAGIVGGVYQLLSTGADIRSWTALPKNFQMARIPMPAGKSVTIKADNGTERSINIPPTARNVIIYVRAVSKNSEPAIDLIEFQ